MELRETHLLGYHVMKDVIQNAGEQLDEGESQRVPRAKPSVLMGLGCVTLLTCRCVHKPRSLWTLYCWDLWRLPHVCVISH